MGGDGPHATPTITGGRVYTSSSRGPAELSGRRKNGDVLSAHNIIEENQAELPMLTKSCSPLVVDERVIVSAGGDHHHSLVAYHKDTGKVLWHTGRATVQLCFARADHAGWRASGSDG